MDDITPLIWRTYYTRHVLPLVRVSGHAYATPVGPWGFGKTSRFLFTKCPGGVRPIGRGLFIEYPESSDRFEADLLLEGGVCGVALNWACTEPLDEHRGNSKEKIEKIFVGCP